MDLRLAGKSVVVTGGASNIGRAIALVFGHCGAKVAILDIDKDIHICIYTYIYIYTCIGLHPPTLTTHKCTKEE